MKKISKFKLFSNKYVNYSLLMILGIFIGWLSFHPSRKNEEKHDHSTEVVKSTIWTCAMHPQIRMEEPGKCPICGMELIPVAQSSTSSIDPSAVHLSKEAAQLANVLTSVVTKQTAVKEVRLYGKVQADERLLQSQVAHVPGRIERLSVNFTGESIVKGQVLAQIYSPELITAQQELLEAAKTKQTQPAIYDAAKEKLRQWKLTDNQISTIEESGTTRSSVEVLSNTNGIVTARLVNTGDYVSQGTALFKIADLSRVWVLFDAYESDLQFLRKGEKISFTLQALPGNNYSANIVFIDPVIDPVTRVAKVRVETENQSGRLKPEMFASGIISSTLDEYRNNIVIPRSAVLWTGKRSIVYVKQPGTDEPIFKIREIGLGPMLGESYVIIDGLSEGEEIVTSGTFSVDAAAQLEGKPSMMNPGGGKTNAMPGMVMPGDSKPDNDSSMAKMDIPVKLNVNMDFIMQLNTVYDQYILLKNAFVQSDEKRVKQAAQRVQQALGKADMKLLTGDARLQWMNLSGKLDNQIKQIASAGKLEDQRKAFSIFNDNFYKLIKTFSLMGKTVYYQFCPMMNDGSGAYWLSETNDIRNPYYGESMLTCGETREIMKF
ncbi:MAG: efflux RND transporter periplasmic adaptor subunit [Odoribacter sp.]|nr:efflux RND transporter periplasmic adaptor subunit [Odoribacter sp.]